MKLVLILDTCFEKFITLLNTSILQWVQVLQVSEFRTYVTLAYKARKETEVFIVAGAFQEGKLGCYLDFPWKEGVVG